jgi:hypothetical protein
MFVLFVTKDFVWLPPLDYHGKTGETSLIWASRSKPEQIVLPSSS